MFDRKGRQSELTEFALCTPEPKAPFNVNFVTFSSGGSICLRARLYLIKTQLHLKAYATLYTSI